MEQSMELNLNNEEAKVNEDYYLKGNLEAGIEGALLKNDKMFNEIKSGTWSQTFNTKNIDYKIGAVDGARYVQYSQKNVEAVKQACKEKREFYKEHGTDNPFFAGTFHAMELPKCFVHEITSKWFNNRPWELIKQVKKDKILFYAIVNEYYSDFVCHPSGKIPLPYNPAIPTK
jgi:hypothetical protein|tara:strand:- start:2166 stop:2684 length:519 start_codon:yes stop_codon:yes gene_type:complete